MSLIDRDALIEEFRNMEGYYALGEGQAPLAVKDIVEVINDADTVDAAPVVHGEWIDTGRGLLLFSVLLKCSACGYEHYMGKTNFCSNCGADMRERK